MPTDTFTVAVNADDGSQYRSSSGSEWPPTGGYTVSSGSIGYAAKGATYSNNHFLRWNTSALPDDAVITAARVGFQVAGVGGGGEPEKLEADWYDFGGEPPTSADYIFTVAASIFPSITRSTIPENAWYWATLTDFSGISKSGYTGIRFALSDDGKPDGNRSVEFRTKENLYPAQLEVTYTTGGGPQTRSVTGLLSGQGFGAVLARAHQSLSVAGVQPAGYLRTITNQTISGQKLVGGSGSARLGQPTVTVVVGIRVVLGSGVGSSQAFGVVTVTAIAVRPVSGLGSAQAFGAVTVRAIRSLSVAGVPSAQGFGITAPKTSIKIPVAGVPSAGVFGAIVTRTGRSVPVAGLASAQAFGTVRPAYRVRVAGLGSARAFGVLQLHTEITLAVAGLGSAQQFGSLHMRVVNIWIWPTTFFPSTGGSLTNQVICGDGHTVGGWDYLPATGRPAVLELDPHEVSTLDLVPTLAK